MGRLVKRIFVFAAGLLLGAALYYGWQALSILNGYGAKIACSCVMLAGRQAADVIESELGSFPLILGTYAVDYRDSSVSASVLGVGKKVAIYRKGLGCTLVVGIDEVELRGQKMNMPHGPAFDPDTVEWPTGNLVRHTPGRYDSVRLDAVLDEAFSEPGGESLRRTRSVIVVHKGNILAERYAPGFDEESLFNGWSMSKSITNALVGILVGQGKLNIQDPAPVKSWQGDARKNITLNHLMHASSGLEWAEVYAGPSPATNMLFRKKDAGLFAAQSDLASEPGTDFYYSSGTTNIISRIIREAISDEDYYRFPYEELLYKTGMVNTTLEPDAGGTFVGSSFTFATARDWARFGLLYLNDGIWNGERILPEGWIDYTTTPAPAAERGEYGAQFWLNAGAKDDPSNRYYPGVPVDMFWADGYEGQNVFIIPSEDLVVVKLSLSTGNYLDDNRFLAGIIDALP